MSFTETHKTNEMPLPEKLLQMISGVWVSQAIYVAAKLGIADLLQDQSKSSQELAESTNVDASSLYRVLRALASIGIFAENEHQQFELTPLAAYLKSDVPGSLRDFTIMLGEPWHVEVWGNILHSVKTGKIAFEQVHGMELFSYFAQNPTAGKIFDQAMTSFTASIIPAVLSSYNFSSISNLVDVGGGHGVLLTEILKANPTMTGIVFDQPFVVAGAKDLIAAAGISDRCAIVGGDFFESIPSGGNAYMMKNIIHDWDQERALMILKNCYKAMSSNSKLLLVEIVIPPRNEPSVGKFLDLEMLLISGGRERTEAEYRELLAQAGFRLTQVFSTPSPLSIIEAVN